MPYALFTVIRRPYLELGNIKGMCFGMRRQFALDVQKHILLLAERRNRDESILHGSVKAAAAVAAAADDRRKKRWFRRRNLKLSRLSLLTRRRRLLWATGYHLEASYNALFRKELKLLK